MTPTDPRVERLKTLHADCIYAAMTLEREQGASAGFDEIHPAWVAAKKADDAFFAALSEALGDSQPVARLEHDTDEAGTLRVVYASPQRAEPASVQAGWKLLKDTTFDERSFPEDYKDENGSYHCVCHHCLRNFVGYKRRVTCKVCAALAAHPSTDQNM